MAAISYPLTDPASARPLIQQALEAQKFKVTWADDWNGTAEIGSSKGVALAGGFRPHIRLGVAITSGEDGPWVQVVQTTTGAAGGLMGLSKTKKAWKATTEALTQHLQGAGQLRAAPVESA